MKKLDKNAQFPVYLFHEGNNFEAYRYFGAHPETRGTKQGVVFRVWAPHAKAVSVVGDFNSWIPGSHPMYTVSDGIWEAFIEGIQQYDQMASQKSICMDFYCSRKVCVSSSLE